MKTLQKIVMRCVWTVITVYLAAIIMVHIPFVQTWIAGQASELIGKKLGTKVVIGKVQLGLLNRIVIDRFELYDKQSKPMLRSSRLAAKVDYAGIIRNGRIYISSAQLFGVKGMFYKTDSASKTNFAFVLDSLASKDKSKKSNIELSVNSLIIRHGAISYDQYDKARTPKQFNTAHMDFSDISAHLLMPYYTADSVALEVKKLSFKESSGLDLRKLSFMFEIRLEAQRRKGGRLLSRRRMQPERKTGTASLTDFELVMPATDLHISRIDADFTATDGKPDTETLQFKGEIDQSAITLADMAWLVPTLARADKPLYLQSTFGGTASSVTIDNIYLHSPDNGISLTAAGSAAKDKSGLRWFADIKQLVCEPQGLGELISSIDGGNNGNGDTKATELPSRMGGITYKGKIFGNDNEITADGEITSGIGRADIRARKNGLHISASIGSNGIDIGRLTADEKLGLLAADIQASCDLADGKARNIKVSGTIPRLDYNGYSYTGIKADAAYDANTVEGLLEMDDPNGRVSVSGKVGLDAAMKSADITATIRELDLAALKISDKWHGAKFNADVTADIHAPGTEPELARGRLNISNSSFVADYNVYEMNSLTVTAGDGYVTMNSDFGHAELIGRYKLKTVAQSVMNMLHTKLPTLCPKGEEADNMFLFNAEINNTDWLAAVLGVPLTLDSPLTINAHVDDMQGKMSLLCKADRLTYDESAYENISLSAGTPGDTLTMNGNVRKIMDNGHKVDLGFSTKAIDDKISTAIHWDNNRKRKMAGTLNAETRILKRETGKTDVDIEVKPSRILINDTIWNVLPANITYSDGDLAIQHFAIEHNRQHIKIDGMATRHPEDSITVDLQGIDVNYVLSLVNFHSVEFSGYMTGKAYIKSVFYEPDAYADVTVDRFRLENGRLGTLYAGVKWNKADKQIDIDAHADDEDGTQTLIKGYVSPPNNNIDLAITAKGSNLEFLHSFCGSFMDNVKAQGHGELRLHGALSAINLTGEIVADGSVRIKPTNVTYYLENDTVRFLPDNIAFRADTIRDRNGNIGIINGNLHHNNLRNLRYNIGIRTENLLCYDTKSYGDDTFYGTAYGTGVCTIQGRSGRVDIDIDITPDKDSFIEYNAASPDAIADQQFITWNDAGGKRNGNGHATADSNRNGTTDEEEEEQPIDIPSDMRINFLINMTPDATLRVLMDQNTGDYIALNGNGTVRASYFNKGSFDMFGTLVIDHGVYTLTIQNIMKKVFQFQQGGTILFGGNPYDAALNLQAVYTVSGVSLSDLQLGSSFTSNNVRVNCIMNISGTPLAPQVDFNIDMPTVSEDAEQMVRTVINSEEEMNQQVVYLLSIGRFYIQGNNNSTEQGQNQTSLAMQSLLSGTISQQINTLLGSLVKNNNWTFGANISTGDEGFNNAEYEGMLSGRLLNNRLIINGQFGYRDNQNATTSFIGDFDVSYLLTPNGNVALKVYNQTNDRYFTKSSLNTQGIGLMLKKDFDKFKELFGGKK